MQVQITDNDDNEISINVNFVWDIPKVVICNRMDCIKEIHWTYTASITFNEQEYKTNLIGIYFCKMNENICLDSTNKDEIIQLLEQTENIDDIQSMMVTNIENMLIPASTTINNPFD